MAYFLLSIFNDKYFVNYVTYLYICVMKKNIISFILLLFTAISLFAGDTILDFLRADSDGKVITVKWKSNIETDVSTYIVERSGTNQVYEEIDREQAKGFASNYQYIDESAFKIGDNQQVTTNTYFYRITILKKDNSKVISNYTSVTHNPSSMRRTWGMLKEMFR
jgi:hypothetical protein